MRSFNNKNLLERMKIFVAKNCPYEFMKLASLEGDTKFDLSLGNVPHPPLVPPKINFSPLGIKSIQPYYSPIDSMQINRIPINAHIST